MSQRFNPQRRLRPNTGVDDLVELLLLGNGRLFKAAIFIGLFFYWLLAWQLERPVITAVAGQPAWVNVISGLILPRVWRHFVPVIAGWWLAKRAASSLIHSLYDLPSRESARQFMTGLQSDSASLGSPIPLTAARIATGRDEEVLLRVGGPGLVRIGPTDVVVTEKDGVRSRILGHGDHRLYRFEYIHTMLNLEVQTRSERNVPLLTRDGIEITADLSITYRLSDGGEPATRSHPYPFDENAVALAAYKELVLAEGDVATWESLPLKTARSQLATIVSRYTLDELLYPRAANEPTLSLKNELERRTRAALAQSGIALRSLSIGRLDLPHDVTAQYIDFWLAQLNSQIQLQQVAGTAGTLEEIEIARAEAEITMIQAILEGVQRARKDGHTNTIREVIALRLIEALEKMAQQSEEASPAAAMLLPRLNEMRQQLDAGEEARGDALTHG